MLWLYSNLKFMPQAEGFSTPWVLTSCVVTETLCTLTFFWLCSACKTRVYFCNYRVKRRNGELSNRWNCGLFWCHKFYKRVILDNRTQIHCIAKQWFNSLVSSGFQWFPVKHPWKVRKCHCENVVFYQHRHAFETISVLITSASIIFNDPV